MTQPYSHSDFVRLALIAFPELREEFEDNAELLHVQMGAFARRTQRAKGEGDWDAYARCVRLADEMWRHPDYYLQNALNVSYLEHLDFDGPRGAIAWEHLTPALRDGWRAMRAYNERLSSLPQKQKRKRR